MPFSEFDCEYKTLVALSLKQLQVQDVVPVSGVKLKILSLTNEER